MFIRTKTINDKDYAYLVENKYTSKGSRQKVKKYLGRCFKTTHAPILLIDENYENLLNSFFKSIKLPELVSLDLKRKKIRFKNKLCVLKLNDGYVYSGVLKRIYSLKKTKENVPGETLAKALSNTGIEFSSEFFIKLYNSMN